MTTFARTVEAVDQFESRQIVGTVDAVRGMTVLVRRLRVPIGSVVRIEGVKRTREAVFGEVIGFDAAQAIVMLLGGANGTSPGDRVLLERTSDSVMVGDSWLGRVIDGLGRPIDGGPPPAGLQARPLFPPVVNPMSRGIIDEPLPTGVRALDGITTIGKGQRIGIFAGPGVGKSTLMASIARGTTADVNVIALVGERGREVKEFIVDALGAEGLARSVVVVATGDESPLLRVRAMAAAIAAAEHFRDAGRNVMLMIDSITRFAQAQRQIGLAAGDQPATKGYPPSVFSRLPHLLERAGGIEGGGSITGIYTVLVEGDDLTEPVADAAKGILDGHVVLSRRLANRGHFPAIDPLDSISRVADQVSDANHITARRRVIELLSAHRENEELINIGAYARGSNPMTDVAIALKPSLDAFLRQESDERAEFPVTCRGLCELAAESERLRQAAVAAAGNPTAG
ncbi:MAG: FliI/YscN family ATPase [Planctomycetota bacterium]|nr:FliI/YscN family ATPase [Planctomycetota bacterium]